MTEKRVKDPWWHKLILAGMLCWGGSCALWGYLDKQSREVSGFIPSMYTEQDLVNVREVSCALLDCWVVSTEDPDCFFATTDEATPFYWDLFDQYLWMPEIHPLGDPYEVDTEALGSRMGMDWPEEERRDFANSRTYDDDGIAVLFVTSMETDFLERRWRARLYEGEKLPFLKGIRMAEVHTVIAPTDTSPGATITFYLRATENGWLLFDWEIS